MNEFFCWIEKEYKSFYLDSKKRGLRCKYSSCINEEQKNIIKKYILFLTKNFFFPIRCTIRFVNKYDRNIYSKQFRGAFLDMEENKKYPEIVLLANTSKKKISTDDLLFNLTCLLTYYFQWYFFLDKERSHRSLEIEATKNSNYLLGLFYEKHNNYDKA